MSSASGKAGLVRPSLPREPGVPDRLLGSAHHVLEAATVKGDRCECLPDVREAGIVARLLEQRQRRARERLELVQVSVGSDKQPALSGHDSRKRLARFVAGRLCMLGCRLGQRGSSMGVSHP